MPRSPTMLRLLQFLVTLALWPATGAAAQQRLEIDHSSGREVINQWEYGFRSFVEIDHARKLLYVFEASDPLAALAISLNDGALVSKYGGAEGEGPGELQNANALAATTDGVYASDHVRVNHWDSSGNLVSTWRPNTPSVMDVCALGGQPAVPLPGGALVRSTDGPGVILGRGRAGRRLMVDLASAREAMFTFTSSEIVCMGDVAYVLTDLQVHGHSAGGTTTEVKLPPELVERGRRRQAGARGGARIRPFRLFHDGNGNLVISMWRSRLAGAIIDPETGCHSIVMDPGPPAGHAVRFAGMYQDSAVVLVNTPTTRMVEGKPTPVFVAGEYPIIALRPLRRVGGEPCKAQGPQPL